MANTYTGMGFIPPGLFVCRRYMNADITFLGVHLSSDGNLSSQKLKTAELLSKLWCKSSWGQGQVPWIDSSTTCNPKLVGTSKSTCHLAHVTWSSKPPGIYNHLLVLAIGSMLVVVDVSPGQHHRPDYPANVTGQTPQWESGQWDYEHVILIYRPFTMERGG